MADKAQVEAIVRDPVLTTWTLFDGAGQVDITRFLVPPSFTILGDEGCFLLDCIGPGRYAVHTNLLPHCRGVAALRAAREATHLTFIQTDCTEVVSMVPGNMPHVLWFAKAMGMQVAFNRQNLWPAVGRLWNVSFMSMSIDDWILEGHCSAKGRWFHEKLADANHPEDPVHDFYVGAAVEMVQAGNVQKAVSVYNRWAAFALYEQIKVLSEQPLRIDIRSHVLRVEEGNFHVEDSSWQ